jgi:DNA-binding transcriptional ArsR family regulator
MGHPLRGRLLQAVWERSDPGVSVQQLAARLDEPKRKIRYHLDALGDLGLVEVIRTTSRRGVIERFYRVSVTPWITEEPADRDQARRVLVQGFRAVLSDARAAIGARLFGTRPGHAVIRIAADVDLKGWRELRDIQERALAEAQAVAKRSRARLDGGSESRISAVAATLLFEVPPWPHG